MTAHKDRSGESGSVLLYILIAVAAFAALSFAVSRSSRDSAATIDSGKVDLATTELLDYVTSLRGAIQNMAIQGVKQNQICFDSPMFTSASYQYAACSIAKNKVFDNYGGNAPSPHAVSSNVVKSSLLGSANYGMWSFPNGVQVKGVGQDCAGNPLCNDLIAMVEPLNDPVCKSVNKKMGVSIPDSIPSNLTPVTTSPYLGSFIATSVIDATNLIGKRTGCFQNSDGHNVFYAVLIAN